MNSGCVNNYRNHKLFYSDDFIWNFFGTFYMNHPHDCFPRISRIWRFVTWVLLNCMSRRSLTHMGWRHLNNSLLDEWNKTRCHHYFCRILQRHNSSNSLYCIGYTGETLLVGLWYTRRPSIVYSENKLLWRPNKYPIESITVGCLLGPNQL